MKNNNSYETTTTTRSFWTRNLSFSLSLSFHRLLSRWVKLTKGGSRKILIQFNLKRRDAATLLHGVCVLPIASITVLLFVWIFRIYGMQEREKLLRHTHFWCSLYYIRLLSYTHIHTYTHTANVKTIQQS